jgi:EcsC protein family
MASKHITKYDRQALDAIHSWKTPELGWWGKTMEIVNWPLEKAGEAIFNTPYVGEAIEKSFAGTIGLLNDAASWAVPKNAILKDFRKAGHSQVDALEEIQGLPLEDIDRVIGYLAAKYKGIALAEGAGTGVVGLVGIPVDLIALLGMNLRAIGEYATYYGFDVSNQAERLFMMNILGFASSPSDAAKQASMAQLVKIAREVAKKKAWKDLEAHTFVKIVQQIAKALGVRLTKAKLAQVIPAMGAAVGGGFNAYYTGKVCDAAFFLYRERFLAQKYGDEVLESPVPEAEEVGAGVPEIEIAEADQAIRDADGPKEV